MKTRYRGLRSLLASIMIITATFLGAVAASKTTQAIVCEPSSDAFQQDARRVRLGNEPSANGCSSSRWLQLPEVKMIWIGGSDRVPARGSRCISASSITAFPRKI
jgi:hypothetical protein